MISAPEPFEKPARFAELAEQVHEKVELVTLDCSEIIVEEAEQICELLTVLITAGFGLTVNTTF